MQRTDEDQLDGGRDRVTTAPTSSLRRRLTALCSLLTLLAFVWTGWDSYQRERLTLEDLGENIVDAADTLAGVAEAEDEVDSDDADDEHAYEPVDGDEADLASAAE